MKNLLTLRNVLKCGAVVLGLVAFFFMFGDQLYVEAFGARAYSAFDKALFSENGSVLSGIGYILAGVSALGTCALIFVDVPQKKFINLGLALVFIVSAVFVFLCASIVNGNVGGSAYHLTAFPIISGILSILAGLLVCASEFVKDKKLA